jgi:putative heme transporter
VSATPGKERLGDRIEHRIEEHVDAEREIERGEASQPTRKKIVRTAIWLTITGVSLYLVAPSVFDVLGSADEVGRIAPLWLVAMVGLQALSLGCLWALQRLSIHSKRWTPVITSQLAGNALAKVAPGGGALGAALQFKMLVQAGLDRARSVAGLTAVNLLTFAVVCALPVLAIPAIVRGYVRADLAEGALVGLAVFAVLFTLAAFAVARDGPLRLAGRAVQGVRNRLRRSSPPQKGLPSRLLKERDRLLAILGPRWKRALLFTVGRWAFDYASLLAALAAVGSHPRPTVALLAFCVAQVLAQIPATPGGLGFVEAGLTATLALAGVSPGDAALATFAYRLVSYWLPMPVGLVAAIVHQRKFGGAAQDPAAA